jgi:dTDP-4-dehydrorhamnose reductase
MENNLKVSCDNYTILRPNWMFGSLQDHKFVGKIIKKLILNQDIKVSYDVSGSYTYTKDLANIVLELVKENKIKSEHIFHVTNKGIVTRYDSALELKKLLNSNSNIIPTENKIFQPNLKVSFNCNAQSKYIPLKTWQEAFKDFLKGQ